jgi:hypothetical protein
VYRNKGGEAVRISKFWMVVLAATLALYGLFLLDVLDFSSGIDVIGIGMIASAVLLLLDR